MLWKYVSMFDTLLEKGLRIICTELLRHLQYDDYVNIFLFLILLIVIS